MLVSSSCQLVGGVGRLVTLSFLHRVPQGMRGAKAEIGSKWSGGRTLDSDPGTTATIRWVLV